jgi:hypothetical protein
MHLLAHLAVNAVHSVHKLTMIETSHTKGLVMNQAVSRQTLTAMPKISASGIYVGQCGTETVALRIIRIFSLSSSAPYSFS